MQLKLVFEVQILFRFLFKSFCETDFANYPSGFILSSCRYCRNIKEKRYRDHLFIQYVIFRKSNISYSYCAYQGARNDTLSVNFAVVLIEWFHLKSIFKANIRFFLHLVSTYSDPLRSKKYSKVHACTTLVMVAFIYKSPAADRCT